MRIIYKYELLIENEFEIETPRIFKPIHVGEQNGKIYVWAEVDPNSMTFNRIFHCVPTGTFFSFNAKHLGSVVESNAPFVWHFYWYPNPIVN